MSRRRSLGPEERELWQAVARSARPLRPHRPAPPAVPESTPKPAPAPLPAFRLGELAPSDPAPALARRLAPQPLAMDAGTFARMTRGRMAPEARIDLHGMTLAEAHPELIRFVLNAQGRGLRLVLVITGKGKPADDYGSPRHRGVLRQQVPAWLRLPPLAAAVQQVAEAHPRHGGAGALYLWLRRLR